MVLVWAWDGKRKAAEWTTNPDEHLMLVWAKKSVVEVWDGERSVGTVGRRPKRVSSILVWAREGKRKAADEPRRLVWAETCSSGKEGQTTSPDEHLMLVWAKERW